MTVPPLIFPEITSRSFFVVIDKESDLISPPAFNR
ncbi:hypothetical protein BAZSYMA_ACONTIG03627_9 [Bathymodiolus azoricus thioautotrophic gill symbiont]|uniref:Uncharacterized protein n=1 Tax=Bathymodiolus azoricus thioautotrophic gill symbiont TaxID=235205 RepID=A0A1H6K2N9_9GAMM|nr:hypothetical protein BAZSYMA_ACONTIG03627_9 [Bathymodiolus azoricus thioautotrophic gill symbiont]